MFILVIPRGRCRVRRDRWSKCRERAIPLAPSLRELPRHSVHTPMARLRESPTAVLFLRPVSCSFLSEITKLSLRRKRGGGNRKIPPIFRGGAGPIKTPLPQCKRRRASLNKKHPSSMQKKGDSLKQKNSSSARPHGETKKQLLRAAARRRIYLPKFSCYRGGPFRHFSA